MVPATGYRPTAIESLPADVIDKGGAPYAADVRGVLKQYADDKFATIALALMDGHARDVARHVGETLKALIAYEILGHDGDRLRDVDQWSVGLGRARRAVGVDTDRSRARILRFTEGLRRGLRLGPSRGL